MTNYLRNDGENTVSIQGDEKQRLLVNDVDFEKKDLEDQTAVDPQGTYYEVFFVTMPLFCGYACLFALQHEVKNLYGIQDNTSSLSHAFAVAASLVYIGNLVFRLGHNILFFYAPPRVRVLISMSSMCLSMAIITCLFLVDKNSEKSLVWVFLAYGLGGLGIGTFESNLLSTITPLGKSTKLWAILGIPVGVNSITVFGFILLQLGVLPGYIYLGVMIYIGIGIAVFLFRIYRDAGLGNAISLKDFFYQLTEWREWFPQIKWHCLALMIDMFCVSLFSPGVILYIYDEKTVNFPMWHKSMRTDWLFAIYDAGFFLGDTLSRRIFYPLKTIFPFCFLLFAAIGATFGLTISELVPFGGFFVAFCNGAIYSQATRKIDASIDKRFNLIAFSFWLFIGDIGSVVGSNLTPYVATLAKREHHI